ncbi:hypothetical protein ACFW1A_24920 [Kitasatospora sp. NPDC058965]|uniref:hypothetical protein n=1 Tax=Kitasatospora sp. NPDC058965 TaxID=3346682 RepID=UPI0036C76D1F
MLLMPSARKTFASDDLARRPNGGGEACRFLVLNGELTWDGVGTALPAGLPQAGVGVGRAG